MEYKILCKRDLDGLELCINELLKDGWMPVGGIATSKSGFPMQAMTRTRKPNKVSRKKPLLDPMAIVDLYNMTFQFEKVTMKRAPIPVLLSTINKLTADHFNTLADWTTFFESLKLSPFLMGKVQPGQGFKQFKLSLEWVIKPVNLAKIIDRKFHEN